MNLEEKVNYVSNFIIADRKKYLADVIPDIEKYIYAHNLIISRNLLYILVFSHDPLRDATEIANHICEHIKYVEMRTRVPHREFDIFINFQLYARVMKVEKIANKNIKLISQFREKYPECKKSESKISDRYNKMIIEAMGGPGYNNVEN